MTGTRFEFYFDIHSPYSYLASTQLPALERRVGQRAVWKPMLLGGVFKSTGNRSPATLPAKARYTWIDVQRWAIRYNVPVHFPGWFPGNSLLPLRACTAAFMADEEQGRRLTIEAFRAAWVDNIDMSLPEAMMEVAAMAGLDGAHLVGRCRDQDVKDRLRATTEDAVARKVFGAPTFFVNDELFFGNDRMDWVEQALEGRP